MNKLAGILVNEESVEAFIAALPTQPATVTVQQAILSQMTRLELTVRALGPTITAAEQCLYGRWLTALYAYYAQVSALLAQAENERQSARRAQTRCPYCGRS